MSRIPPFLYALGIAAGFGMLAWMADRGHFSWDTLGALLLTFLGGLIRHAMPDGSTSVATVKRVDVAGVMSLRLLCLMAFALSFLVCLAGCAPMATSWYTGAEAKVRRDVQATDDNVVVTLRDAWCGLPYGAIKRGGADVAETVQRLCGPLPSVLSPSDVATLLRLAPMIAAPAK